MLSTFVSRASSSPSTFAPLTRRPAFAGEDGRGLRVHLFLEAIHPVYTGHGGRFQVMATIGCTFYLTNRVEPPANARLGLRPCF